VVNSDVNRFALAYDGETVRSDTWHPACHCPPPPLARSNIHSRLHPATTLSQPSCWPARASHQPERVAAGVDVCGERLAALVLESTSHINAQPDAEGRRRRVTSLTLLGYSLGGLMVRYAAGKLLALGYFERVKPRNFITVASPHLGCFRYAAPALSQLLGAGHQQQYTARMQSDADCPSSSGVCRTPWQGSNSATQGPGNRPPWGAQGPCVRAPAQALPPCSARQAPPTTALPAGPQNPCTRAPTTPWCR